MKNNFIQQVILENCRQTSEIQFGNLSTLGYKIWSLRKSEYLRSVNYKEKKKNRIDGFISYPNSRCQTTDIKTKKKGREKI